MIELKTSHGLWRLTLRGKESLLWMGKESGKESGEGRLMITPLAPSDCERALLNEFIGGVWLAPGYKQHIFLGPSDPPDEASRYSSQWLLSSTHL